METKKRTGVKLARSRPRRTDDWKAGESQLAKLTDLFGKCQKSDIQKRLTKTSNEV